MSDSNNKTVLFKRLVKAGIRPSTQRIDILGFISSCKSHPTADEIYASVRRSNPTLSRTTVFNTVRLFAEKGIVNDINISSESTRYDSTQYAPHAHFVCRECGSICDIPIDISALACPDEFVCDNVNVYFKGICPGCQKKSE